LVEIYRGSNCRNRCFRRRVAASVLLSFGYKAVQESRAARKRLWKKVPGALPFLGHLLQIQTPESLLNVLEQWCDEYSEETGYFEMELPCEPVLVVCRADRFLEINNQRPFNVIRSTSETDPAKSIGALGVFSAKAMLGNKIAKSLLRL